MFLSFSCKSVYFKIDVNVILEQLGFVLVTTYIFLSSVCLDISDFKRKMIALAPISISYIPFCYLLNCNTQGTKSLHIS